MPTIIKHVYIYVCVDVLMYLLQCYEVIDRLHNAEILNIFIYLLYTLDMCIYANNYKTYIYIYICVCRCVCVDVLMYLLQCYEVIDRLHNAEIFQYIY